MKSYPARIALALAVASVIGMATLSRAQTSQPADAAEEAPRLIAVKFHADWCGYCKAMGGVFEELQAKFDQQPVLWVTFDQTRDHQRRQSQYLAHAMGLDQVWAENGGKTGFVLLIDAETRDVVAKLTHEQTLKQMGAAVVAAIDETS